MKKTLYFILICFFAVITFGCKKKETQEIDTFDNIYHATIYARKQNIICDDFLENNHIYYGTYTRINDNGEIEKYHDFDESVPSNRTFIVSDSESLDEIINKDSVTVDFDRQMVLIYMFSSVEYARLLELKKTKYENKKMEITFDSIGGKDVYDAVAPMNLYAFIVLDKLDVEECIFYHTTQIKNPSEKTNNN